MNDLNNCGIEHCDFRDENIMYDGDYDNGDSSSLPEKGRLLPIDMGEL